MNGAVISGRRTINYNGNARQALEFYHQVFGGTLEVGTFADYGSAESSDPEKVMHARLDTPDGFTLMAWDGRDGVPYHPGNNVRSSSTATAPNFAAISRESICRWMANQYAPHPPP